MDMVLPLNRGVSRRRIQQAKGYLLRASNARYLPGQESGALYALLGRAKFNAAAIGAAANPAADDSVGKALFPFYVDGGTSKLVHHRGGSLWEADLGAAGAFTEAFAISTSTATPRGIPAAYKRTLYYPVGRDGWSNVRHFLARTNDGWRLGGYRTFTNHFTAAATGSGMLSSSTSVKYTTRLYDPATDLESLHGEIVEVGSFSGASAVRLTFASGVPAGIALGTYLRIYRTLFDEPEGTYYRVDGTGNGIALPQVGLYTFNDTASNTEAQINGTVRADGQEGTDAWAEHGGPPPQAGGAIMFQDHLVCFDCYGREQDIIYSAQGYPEGFPVNFDGEYEYWMTLASSKQDNILAATIAGGYLLLFGSQAVYRLAKIPTFANPGFDRRIEDLLSDQHGICGRFAVDRFGLGAPEQEPQWAIYVSREHGPMLTNGVSDQPVIDRLAWETIADRAQLDTVVVRNYPTMREVWVSYTPIGEPGNTEAMLLDYSAMDKYGIRVTWPVDVQIDDAVLAWGNDNEPRFYLVSETAGTVYVQDSGSVDEQENTNEDGDIELDWRLAQSPGGGSKAVHIRRGTLSGSAGAASEFTVTVSPQDGVDDYDYEESADVGPGETEDAFHGGYSGQAFQVSLYRLGPTGSTYEDGAAGQAPSVESVMLEARQPHRQGRTKGT